MRIEKEHRVWCLGIIFLSVLCFPFSTCLAQADSTAVKPRKVGRDTIYQGVTVKLDILSPVIEPAISKGGLQHYEVAANVRLKNRFYPTFEIGYAGGKTACDTVTYKGHGGFFRVGCDINPLRKNPKSPHALLVGVRLGTSVQDWKHPSHGTGGVKADCWGEIVAGCQVEICKVKEAAFYMGWMGRFKFLFTRQGAITTSEDILPVYIPGFGSRDDIGWGANYYLGWRF